jgi:hypothetical protein
MANKATSIEKGNRLKAFDSYIIIILDFKAYLENSELFKNGKKFLKSCKLFL